MKHYNFFLTSKAVERVERILSESSEINLRIGVKGGKCEGYSYHLELTSQAPSSQDCVFKFDSFNVLIDNKSIKLLNGTILDWKKMKFSHYFDFNNPNAQSTCSCNISFSVSEV